MLPQVPRVLYVARDARKRKKKKGFGGGGGGGGYFGVKESPSSRLDLGWGGGGRVDILAK